MECRSYNLPGNAGNNYMLANIRTESDRVLRKKGVIKMGGHLNK